jgi:hypothetical protein
VTVNASPSTNFKVIHSKLLFGQAETRFDGPAAKGNSQKPSEGNATSPDNLIRDEVFELTGSHVASDDQGLLGAG